MLDEHRDQLLNDFDENPEVPPRSRLFSFKPESVGTSEIESLSSYISRLAQAHSVSVRMLLEKELAPFVPGLGSRMIGGFKTFQKSINAYGIFVDNIVRAVSDLTGRKDIYITTMSRWRNILPLIALVRNVRAWCPLCYQESADSDQTVFDHLLWAIEAVTICPIHNIALATTCPHCERTNPHISTRSQPGFCMSCNAWLGSNQEAPTQPYETNNDWEVWKASEIGKMLAVAPTIEDPPAERLRELISHCFLVSRFRYHGAFARSLGMEGAKVNRWLQGAHVPLLESQFRFYFQANISPSQFFSNSPGSSLGTADPTPRLYPRTLQDTDGMPPYALSIQEARKILEGGSNLEPPKPLKAFQCETRWTTRKMKSHFPLLCQTLIARYKATYKRPIEVANGRSILLAALKDPDRPALSEVATRAGYSVAGLKKQAPDLCKKVVARHTPKRLKLDWKKISRRLRASLIEDPPPTLRGIAQELDTNVSALSHKFPEWCKAIGARSLEHRKSAVKKRRALIREEVFRTVRLLESQDQYPSVLRVLSNMRTNSSTTTVHRILKETRVNHEQ